MLRQKGRFGGRSKKRLSQFVEETFDSFMRSSGAVGKSNFLTKHGIKFVPNADLHNEEQKEQLMTRQKPSRKLRPE